MNKKITIPACVFLIYVLGLILLTLGAFDVKDEVALETPSEIKVSEFFALIDGNIKKVSLPMSIKDLGPRTPVTIITDFMAKNGDSIYIKSVYAPIKVYANDKLIYQYGQDGSYPKFMQDPPTLVKILQLPNTNQPIKLKMEYLSPTSRDVLTLHPVLLGSESTIIKSLFSTMGFSFTFSIIQMLIGVFLIIISLFIISFERKGIAFFWLGVFSLTSGAWTFGESNLTALFFHNYTLLYILAFMGLFSFPIPLMYFGLSIIDLHNKKPIEVTALFLTLVCSLVMLLQILGLVSLSKSMYLFHILVPLSLSFFTLYILYESIRYKNKDAIRFFFPVLALPVFAVLEVINYQFRFTNVLSFFFQMGILIFIFMTSMIGGVFIRDSLILKGEKHQLEYEVNLMKYQIESRKKHDMLLLENAENIKRQRHDLRHQLAVIRNLSESKNPSKLTSYIDTMIVEIPSDNSTAYCENIAVNAIITHYASLARKHSIDLQIKLNVPDQVDEISDNSLCVIFGNLFENAIEACILMEVGDRYINLYSRLQYETLTITMDNSFDGKVIKRNNKFISRKREDFGVGLTSVARVAEKHRGGVKFETNDLVFSSSVYVKVG